MTAKPRRLTQGAPLAPLSAATDAQLSRRRKQEGDAPERRPSKGSSQLPDEGRAHGHAPGRRRSRGQLVAPGMYTGTFQTTVFRTIFRDARQHWKKGREGQPHPERYSIRAVFQAVHFGVQAALRQRRTHKMLADLTGIQGNAVPTAHIDMMLWFADEDDVATDVENVPWEAVKDHVSTGCTSTRELMADMSRVLRATKRMLSDLIIQGSNRLLALSELGSSLTDQSKLAASLAQRFKAEVELMQRVLLGVTASRAQSDGTMDAGSREAAALALKSQVLQALETVSMLPVQEALLDHAAAVTSTPQGSCLCGRDATGVGKGFLGGEVVPGEGSIANASSAVPNGPLMGTTAALDLLSSLAEEVIQQAPPEEREMLAMVGTDAEPKGEGKIREHAWCDAPRAPTRSSPLLTDSANFGDADGEPFGSKRGIAVQCGSDGEAEAPGGMSCAVACDGVDGGVEVQDNSVTTAYFLCAGEHPSASDAGEGSSDACRAKLCTATRGGFHVGVEGPQAMAEAANDGHRNLAADGSCGGLAATTPTIPIHYDDVDSFDGQPDGTSGETIYVPGGRDFGSRRGCLVPGDQEMRQNEFGTGRVESIGGLELAAAVATPAVVLGASGNSDGDMADCIHWRPPAPSGRTAPLGGLLPLNFSVASQVGSDECRANGDTCGAAAQRSSTSSRRKRICWMSATWVPQGQPPKGCGGATSSRGAPMPAIPVDALQGCGQDPGVQDGQRCEVPPVRRDKKPLPRAVMSSNEIREGSPLLDDLGPLGEIATRRRVVLDALNTDIAEDPLSQALCGKRRRYSPSQREERSSSKSTACSVPQGSRPRDLVLPDTPRDERGASSILPRKPSTRYCTGSKAPSQLESSWPNATPPCTPCFLPSLTLCASKTCSSSTTPPELPRYPAVMRSSRCVARVGSGAEH